MLSEFSWIFIIDTIFIILHGIIHVLNRNIIYNFYCEKTRWFLLHSIVNFIVVYYAIDDFTNCIINSDKCYILPWNDNSIKVFNYATSVHIYHCIFFKLNDDDILHHLLMVFICGTLCYIQGTIISSFALFFLSGLPGAIDYFLLYLVKIQKIDKLIEKKIYTLISNYFRAPGCCYTFSLGMNGVINNFNENKIIDGSILLITIILIFWNGQYYLLKSHKSYINYYNNIT